MTTSSLTSLTDSQMLEVHSGNLTLQRSHLSALSERSRNLPSKAWSFSRKKLRLGANSCTNDPETIDDEETMITDYVFEHQRGLFLLGYPFFSGNMLMPLDPPNWATLKGAALFSLEDFPLPDITWGWLWKRWYVDMDGDVDDQGWAYSFQFGGFHWYGAHKFFRSFVRRRKWKRLRSKPHHYEDVLDKKRVDIRPSFDVRSTILTESETFQDDLDQFAENLSSCRIDRERTKFIQSFIENERNWTMIGKSLFVDSLISRITKSFDFPSTRLTLTSWTEDFIKKKEKELPESTRKNLELLRDELNKNQEK